MASSAKSYWTLPRVLVAIAVIFGTFGLLFTSANRSVRRGMDRMMCHKNLSFFGFAMSLYEADNHLSEFGAYPAAAPLIGDTNFHAHYLGRGWRYSRDGIHPACPASPSREMMSYEGWPTNAPAFLKSLWEQAPYAPTPRRETSNQG